MLDKDTATAKIKIIIDLCPELTIEDIEKFFAKPSKKK